MINFVKTPIGYKKTDKTIQLIRHEADKILMLDNLIELIVFTPKGSFTADPDFGFEYWNHEYSNIHHRNFNNNLSGIGFEGLYNDITKNECQESVRKSLEIYEPSLKHVDVSIELNPISEEKQYKRKKVFSKYEVSVRVLGVIDDGLGMVKQYEKRVTFLMEPTVKKATI